MTAAQENREPAPAARDLAGAGPASRHRASGPASKSGGSRLRTQLTALAVVPPVCAALLGVLAVAVLAHASHRSQSQLLHGKTLIAICVLGVLLVLVVVAGFVWAGRVARSASRTAPPPVIRIPAPAAPVAPATPPDTRAVTVTAAAAVAAASPTADNGVFVHLSHRLQSLVHRQIQLLDTLENEVEEPDLLKGLFGVDHLATRMRRHAENLAVLGGAVPRRQWTKPVSVMEVLRSAVSETLDYARVQVIARTPSALNGYVVADVIHLLAELVENATSYSPPDTKVVLRAQPVTAGLVIEIDDRGLGLQQQEYDRLNALLKEPADVNVRDLLEGARIGLYVVAQLAYRHGIAIQLQSNITGGTQALVVLPKSLLAAEPREPEPRTMRERPASAPPPAPAGGSTAVLTSAPVSTATEALRPIATAASTAVADGMAELGDAPRATRPVYGIDGMLPAPRRSPSMPPVGDLGSQSPMTLPGPRPPAPSPAPAADERPSAHGSAPESDSRPPLPRRRPQEHLAAPLAEAAPEPAGPASESLSPSFLADFRHGLARGATEPYPDAYPTEHAPTQEGDR